MERIKLKIGDRVSVKPHPDRVLYVRELHNTKTAGLSYSMKDKSCYGVFYDVIIPATERK